MSAVDGGLARLYRDLALRQAPRILGLGDRDPASPTYGCFDRAYWHYRLVDLANAQQQQAALYLVLLAAAPGRFQGAERLREWALAATSCWASLQHRDGSFDEAYPNERGYCVTALSTAAVAAALLRLGAPGPRQALVRAGRWLAAHGNPAVSNQAAGGALALLELGELLADAALADAGRAQLGELLGRQDPEGFFPEYGGADVGYQSITLALLARCRRWAADPGLDEALARGASAIAGRLDGWGRHDPLASSRRTQYLYPSGLVAAGAAGPLAAHRTGVEAGHTLEPGWLDDRYVIWLATDYLLAAEGLAGSAPAPSTR